MSNLEVEVKEEPQFEQDYEPEDTPLHAHVATLLSICSLLWRQRRRIFRAVVVTMVLSLGLLFLLPNEYTGTVYLNPPAASPISGLSLLMGAKSGLAGLGSVGDILGSQSPGQLYISQLQTRAVLDRIITRFNLDQLYGTKYRHDTRKILLANTTFEEDRKSGIIKIAVVDKDPKRAADMASAFADELGRLNADLSSTAGRQEREYFEKELQAARGDLEKASKQLSEYGAKNSAIDVNQEGKALVEGIAALQGQLIAAKSDLQGLLKIYTEKHELVQAARARIAELNRQLQEIQGRQAASGVTQTSVSGRREDSTVPSIQRMWGMSVPYMDRYREVKIQEAVVDTLTQQYELAKLRESRRVSDVQVVDPALVPEKKSGPHRLLITLAVGILVFMFYSGYILTEHWWQDLHPADPWRVVLEPAIANITSATARTKSCFGLSRLPVIRKICSRREKEVGQESANS